MSAASESKRSIRKAKKKRAAQQMKENEAPKVNATSLKTGSNSKTGLDATIPLSQVVKKSSFTPFLDGERCILCHQERPSITRKVEKSNPTTANWPAVQQFVDKLPLWVCPECRKKVEEDEQKVGLDSGLDTISSEDTVNSFDPDEAQNKDLMCNCHVCAGKRHLVPAKTKEVGELQFSWFEVKYFVRCVYRKAGTTLADDDKLTKTSLDMDRMKSHTGKLTSRDPYQLYERLEAQTREYLTEVRVSLIKFFSSTLTNSLQHAKDCVMTLLDEYQSLCIATDTLKPFFQKLDSNYLNRFKWSWEMMNKELFKEDIFDDTVIRNNLPLFYQQLVSGRQTESLNPELPQCAENSTTGILKRLEELTREMIDADTGWLTAKPLRETYDKEMKFHEKAECESWDEPLKKTMQDNDERICSCENCNFLSNHITSSNDMSNYLLSLKHSLSSSSTCSSSNCPTPCCSKHAQNGSVDSDELSNTTQLLPTALFLNRLTNSKCATSIREALHSFCFDQNPVPTKCPGDDHDLTLSKLPSCDTHENCDDHSLHDPFWYNHDTPPPETASSIQSLILNGTTTGENHCENHSCCTGWEDDDERECEGCEGYEECEEHRIPVSPSIMIPGNTLDVEAPPSSPSSDRSVGDGSSCDTPTSRSSLSEDGKSNNGKYCDCCLCEFYGNGMSSLPQTSQKYVDMRNRLRSRLKEKEKKAVDFSEHPKVLRCIDDTRSVEELLAFINGEHETDQNLPNKTSSKAAKRQRQKQNKAAKKIAVVSSTTEQMAFLFNKSEVNVDRATICEEKSLKNTRQKTSGLTKSQENLTEKENAKNQKKTLINDVKHHKIGSSVHKPGGNTVDEKPAAVEQGSETSVHVNKRKKRKEKKMAAHKSGGNSQERPVVVNEPKQDSGSYVEHTRDARLPVREEAEPKICWEEALALESQVENCGKKTKNRKKKKGKCLDDVFLPKEDLSVKIGHNGEVDETEREVEEFKRFCASAAPVTRKLKLPANVNLKNLNLGVRKS